MASETLQAWVDTGATYTWIPRPVLERLGIAPTERRQMELATGEIIEREVGFALVVIDSRSTPTLCVFGDPDSQPLLGAFTLEGCGLGVDPVHRRLVPVLGRLFASS